MTEENPINYGGREDLPEIVGTLRSSGALRLIANHGEHHAGSRYSFVPYHVVAGKSPVAGRVVPHLCADDLSSKIAEDAYEHLTGKRNDGLVDVKAGNRTHLVYNPSIGRGVAIKILKNAK